MEKCDLCGNMGKYLSLLRANHKKLGNIEVCSECWEKLYTKNEFVGGSTCSVSSCSTCSTCE